MGEQYSLKPAALQFVNWGYRHACRNCFAVRNLNLKIEPGQHVLLLGASGIGKSTILSGAAGLIGNSSGSGAATGVPEPVEDEDGGTSEGGIFCDGQPLREARGKIGLVLQDPEAQMIFDRLGDNVAFGPENLGVARSLIWPRVSAGLEAVGLDGLQLSRRTAHLSGGQMQRLALAGALAMQPRILLLDEPTANLDPDGVRQIVAATKHVLQKTGATLVLVEHRIEPWLNIIDRVVVLGLGATAGVVAGSEEVNGGAVETVKAGLASAPVENKFAVSGFESGTDCLNERAGESEWAAASPTKNIDEYNIVHDDDVVRAANSHTCIVADGSPTAVFNRKDLNWAELGIWLPRTYRTKLSGEVATAFKIGLEAKTSPGNFSETAATAADSVATAADPAATAADPAATATEPPETAASDRDRPIVLRTIDLAIGRSATPIAQHINLTFKKATVYALTGENGTGKSTLALTLAGLLAPVAGKVKASRELTYPLKSDDPLAWPSRELTTRISYVFQNPEHQFACKSVLDEVTLGPTRAGAPSDQAVTAGQKLLREFNLSRYATSNPYTLSGGEKRRLTVAAALATRPTVLILDEPTFGQDFKTWQQIVRLCAELKKSGTCIIVVTHDSDLVQALAAEVIELRQNFVCDPEADFAAKTTLAVSEVNAREEKSRSTSESPYIAQLNPAFRMFGALLIAVPLIFTLDWLSALVALGLDFLVAAAVKLKPWRVIKLSWPVWVGAPSSALAVWLYGKSGGAVWFDWGFIHITDLSGELALATGLRILALGIPAIIVVLGIDATDLADALSQLLHCPDRFVYGGLAGMRLFDVLHEDWAALQASRRSRGLGDDNKLKAFFPQMFALLVLSIRRSVALAKAMEARGFGGKTVRSHARISLIHKKDYVFLGMCLLIPCLAIAAAVWGGTFRLFGG
ncbi:ATP-binding cassette domain-containing protein [Mageeibacillus indolicus]|uniref:ATP-binding cassette domain-containing protein n=1 Tax=Mageeibacillus indolicus TaxID=884684 RepID=UPI0004DCE32F|nr:ATP-binding cassette domain-containing protein [Mageeibacillus indolicus]KFA57173.1 ABC transporter ATP-binding protein [Mageeibacillus indolicus 0009-5]